MITTPRRHKHPSSGANRPSDVGVTVNINAVFNLMAVNPIIERFSRDLGIEYCEGLESSTDYTVPPLFVETLSGLSNRSLPSPAVSYACTGNYSYIFNIEHLYWTMLSQSPHPETTLVVQNVRSLATHQNQQNRGPLGNTQLPPAKRLVFVPAGERDSSQGQSSVACTIQHQNSTPSSSLKNSGIAHITQCVTSTLCATQRRAINTASATSGTNSHSTPAPVGTSTRRLVSSSASSIAISLTPLSSLENLPTTIPNPEACMIITNPLRMRATKKNQRQRQWQLQLQAVSTPQSMVTSSRSIH